MDKISDSVKSVQGESIGFFKYVFNFDNENKYHLMNMIQYTLLTIIPVLIILRGVKYLIPEEDISKGSLEILVESVGQVVLIMLAIWFTNKIIHYIPTYSGENYPKFNEVNFIIPFIIILATMQTKLGAKFNILFERLTNYINGKSNDEDVVNNGQQQQQVQNVVRISQPLAGQHQPSQADYLDRNQLLPSNPQLTAMPPQYPAQNLNATNQQQTMALMNSMEPLAANEGGGWGSVW